MAISILTAHDEVAAPHYCEYVVDLDSEIAQLPGLDVCAPGSLAKSLQSGTLFRLLSTGQWWATTSALTLETLTATHNWSYQAPVGKAYERVDVNVESAPPASAVTFYDYDGTIVYSYTADAFLALTEMPTNPSHEGLTAQGWNWSLPDAQNYVSSCGKLHIGQTYIPTDRKTHVYFTLDSAHLTPYLGFGLNGTVVIDWGDGSPTETVTGNRINILLKTPHQYTSVGDYEITIDVMSGSMQIMGNDSSSEGSYLLGDNDERSAAAHYYRKHITEAQIGSNVSLSYAALYNCSGLMSVTIPDGVTSIAGSAFYNCYSLQSVIIPESVTSIGLYVFWNCYALHSIVIPDSVTYIGDMVFNNCYVLQSIVIPEGITSIHNNMFWNCYSLQSVIIPESVTRIGDYTFYTCYSLQSVTIPESITSIGLYAFNKCCSLQSIIIHESVTSIDVGTFQECSSLQSVIIPDSVTSIGSYAFWHCYALQSIVIPEGVTSIGNSTFQECSSLQSVIIPDSVTSIGENAFANCHTMSSLTFTSTTPPTVAESNAFQNLPTDCTIRVPAGSLSAYTSATNYPDPTIYTYVEI